MVLVSSMVLLAGTASAHGTVKPQTESGTGACTVKSLPSFIAQGEFSNTATVADVIEVSCNPKIYSDGAEVTVTAAQLFDRCGHEVTWYDPNDQDDDVSESDGNSVSLNLDVDGNANVGLIAGPKCMVGESLITLDEDESPYETFTTSFQVLPDEPTTQGLWMEPSAQVEDAESSAVVTIAQAEFTGESESYVRLGARQLYDRCQEGDHLIVIGEDREVVIDEPEVLEAIRLDDDGNGFALVLGSDSCSGGTSLIEADLESSPFTTETATFTVEAPRPERFAG
ncbi:MAG TPA: hypothetical protein VMF09_02155 [Solirubrobacteraceae bacterium]|nr:hypothetical protein [Solirubrobacteraceae bacterium]